MIKVIDNVLSEESYNSLYKLLSNRIQGPYGYFPWYLSSNIAYSDKKDEYVDPNNFGFAHFFTSISKSPNENAVIISQYGYPLLSILHNACAQVGVNLLNLYQGRAFMLTPSISPGKASGIHTDLDFPHQVCLYYFNDSDGDTVFFDNDGKEMYRNTPKKNTAIMFDGNIPHTNETPTNFRYIVNFNYTFIK